MNNKRQSKKANNDKKGKSKKSQKPQGEQELTDNMQGFLITCDRNREQNAVKEAYQIIEQHIEQLYPELADKVDRLIEQFLQQKQEEKEYQSQCNKKIQLEPININDSDLQNVDTPVNENKTQEEPKKEKDIIDQDEPKTYQVKKKWIRESHIKMLQHFDTRVNCLVFMKVNVKSYPELDVDQIGEAIMKTVYEDKIKISRCCYKFVPIKYVFKADREIFKKNIKLLIEKYFTLEKPIPWQLQFKARYTQKMQKSEVLTDINNIMEPLHFNDYRDPQLVIFVEVNGAIMYMNILQNYQKFKEYSIRGDFKHDPEAQNQIIYKSVKQKVQSGGLSDDFQKQQFYEEEDIELF